MTGELATAKAGHDKDRVYLIIREEGDFVYLCDGRLRGVDHPKKKKKKHIQIIHFSVPGTLLEKISQGTASGDAEDLNAQIRQQLTAYLER